MIDDGHLDEAGADVESNRGFLATEERHGIFFCPSGNLRDNRARGWQTCPPAQWGSIRRSNTHLPELHERTAPEVTPWGEVTPPGAHPSRVPIRIGSR